MIEAQIPRDEALLLLEEILPRLQSSFGSLPEMPNSNVEPLQETNAGLMSAVLAEAADRMGDNFPYHHPLYAGQMLKPPHPIARAAYGMAMWLNPNNHALDGGRASSAMEVEAVAGMAAMFGWKMHLGHLTSGGTFANLEALWVASQLAPSRKVVASTQAHYTHQRISGVLGLPFSSIKVDQRGRMDVKALEELLSHGDIGTVVVTIGATATGAVDPLDRILELRERYKFRIHIDAAYGGYFILASNLDSEAARAFALIGQADSIVIDPHKHGLQPYGCGCILFRDPAVGRLYSHDSPYTYFTSGELHLGEISLECSRAGASAVALWATQRLLPLTPGGRFAGDLERCRRAATNLASRLQNDGRFIVPFSPELDILVWAIRAETAAESSCLARELFAACARQDLHLAIVQLPIEFFPPGTWAASLPNEQAAQVACLRSVLMKPHHEQWISEIWRRLDLSMLEVQECKR
ncbi:MAG TPA: aminotransferase class I/II-fold pyridoxal phosphate-dependent enzyme [Acidisarcina sp.]